MTKDELYDYIYKDSKGEKLNNLIARINGQIQEQLVPTFFKGSEAAYLTADFVFDRLVHLLAAASGYLQYKPAEVLMAGEDVYECPKCGYQSYEPKISVPMRKFIESEQLTMQQSAIVDAVRTLSEHHRKLAAIKLIRASFLDNNGGFCRLTEAKDIYDGIMAHSH